MPTPHELLTRLDAIGASLSAADHSLALIGLGSVGLEMDRLDAYSDLDFFAIVEPGHARQFIDKLDWLERVHPVAYAFKNTDVGYKLLYADGIFCEMAVFDLDELAGIPFSPGRVVWKRAEVDDAIATPRKSLPSGGAQSQEHLLGEALTNLYVGLARFRRGEKLSAARFIQQYAVDRVLDLVSAQGAAQPGGADPFTPERRVEVRYPILAEHLPNFVQGYERSPASALVILGFLETHFGADPSMAAAIRGLVGG